MYPSRRFLMWLIRTRWVSPELTRRVDEAIAELGYTPNAVARSLRQSSTKTIGLIVPDNSNPFFAEIAKGVEDAGFDAGYSVILCNSNAMVERELIYLELLKSKMVDGIIFIATTTEIKHLQPLIKKRDSSGHLLPPERRPGCGYILYR